MPVEHSHIVVTGSSGFIGAALADTLRRRGHRVDGWSRRDNGFELDLDEAQMQAAVVRWQSALRGVDTLVHAAARVHQMQERSADAALYRRVNVDAALALARAAAAAGVRRLIFISTAKVYGEGRREPYRENDEPAPEGAYAGSKWLAEQWLTDFCAAHGLALTILRPPLVYGAGVGGNFEALQRLAGSRWPLPFGLVRNRRSLLALDNLVDVIVACCEAKSAPIGVFNVADAEPYSLAGIVTCLRAAAGHSSGLWPIPAPVLYALVAGLRGPGDAQRLLGDFQLEMNRIRHALQWRPRVSMTDVAPALAESGE